MTSRPLLFFVALLLLAGCVGTLPADDVRRPNVIVILADDMGYGDIGAYGATRIETPNIDALAARGLRFTQGYASANVCTPSRAGLLTGRYAIRSGLAWKVVGNDDERGMPDEEETLGELAQRADYSTLYVGKWHLGDFPDFLPTRHGFDEFFGVPHSNDMPDFGLWEGATRIEQPVEQRTLTQRYTRRVVDFVDANADRPFLLVLAHTFPHIPLYASDEFHGRSQAGLYGDTVEELDWSTGEIVAALRRNGLLDDTLIVFTSDNGPFFEGGTAGLKGGKGTTWEAGYRVPFIVSWPARAAPSVSTDAVMNIDLLPTIGTALGVEPVAADIDGIDLSPIFDGRPLPERFLYYFNNERLVGVRSARWKYVTHAYYTGSLGAFEKFDQLPGFRGRYEMLFDAAGAGGEEYSLADRHPDVVARLRVALEAARREFAPLQTREPEQTYPR